MNFTTITLTFIFFTSSIYADVDFAKDVWPILKKRCIKCHGPDYIDKRGRKRKAKAGLRIDSATAIMQGGDNGKSVVPGKPEKSSLYTLTTLPEEDDDVMPAKGPLLTKKQQETLKKWIQQGANFGAWKKAN